MKLVPRIFIYFVMVSIFLIASQNTSWAGEMRYSENLMLDNKGKVVDNSKSWSVEGEGGFMGTVKTRTEAIVKKGKPMLIMITRYDKLTQWSFVGKKFYTYSLADQVKMLSGVKTDYNVTKKEDLGTEVINGINTKKELVMAVMTSDVPGYEKQTTTVRSIQWTSLEDGQLVKMLDLNTGYVSFMKSSTMPEDPSLFELPPDISTYKTVDMTELYADYTPSFWETIEFGISHLDLVLQECSKLVDMTKNFKDLKDIDKCAEVLRQLNVTQQ